MSGLVFSTGLKFEIRSVENPGPGKLFCSLVFLLKFVLLKSLFIVGFRFIVGLNIVGLNKSSEEILSLSRLMVSNLRLLASICLSLSASLAPNSNLLSLSKSVDLSISRNLLASDLLAAVSISFLV